MDPLANDGAGAFFNLGAQLTKIHPLETVRGLIPRTPFLYRQYLRHFDTCAGEWRNDEISSYDNWRDITNE
jgi:hypothetical protein